MARKEYPKEKECKSKASLKCHYKISFFTHLSKLKKK